MHKDNILVQAKHMHCTEGHHALPSGQSSSQRSAQYWSSQTWSPISQSWMAGLGREVLGQMTNTRDRTSEWGSHWGWLMQESPESWRHWSSSLLPLWACLVLCSPSMQGRTHPLSLAWQSGGISAWQWTWRLSLLYLLHSQDQCWNRIFLWKCNMLHCCLLCIIKIQDLIYIQGVN